MDLALYERLKQEISDGCPSCAKKREALDVVFGVDFAAGVDRTVVAEVRVSNDGTRKVTELDPKSVCAICATNRIRSDNSGCPKCKRKVCKDCRRGSGSSRSGFCVECAPELPDGRDGNGGPRPNSGPTPAGIERLREIGKAQAAAKKQTPRRQADPGIVPPPGTICKGCKKLKAAVACASCAGMICGLCARRFNGQDEECFRRPG